MKLPHRNQHALVCELVKQCPACGVTKSVHEFGRCRHRESVRVNPRCKACASSVAKTWRLVNRDQYNAYFREWRKDPVNHAEQSLRVQAWRRENPESVRLYDAASKAGRRRAVKAGTLAVDQWKYRIEEFNGYCAYCLKPMVIGGKKPDSMSLEHTRPLHRGGPHAIENVVPACLACNHSKNDNTLLEYVARDVGGYYLRLAPIAG